MDRAFWLLNKADGLSLIWDRLLGRPTCGRSHPRIALICDLPAGHSGDHKSRAFISRIGP